MTTALSVRRGPRAGNYSTSKAMAEHMVFAMHDAYGLPVTVVRFFNVYGPRQNPIFVISKSIHRILNGREPLLYDSGNQTRCFTYVDDAVAGTLLAADSDAGIGEAFNIGSMTETTMRDAVDLAIKIAKVDSVSSTEAFDTAVSYGDRYEDIPVACLTRPRRSACWGGACKSTWKRGCAAPSNGHGPTRGTSRRPGTGRVSAPDEVRVGELGDSRRS